MLDAKKFCAGTLCPQIQQLQQLHFLTVSCFFYGHNNTDVAFRYEAHWLYHGTQSCKDAYQTEQLQHIRELHSYKSITNNANALVRTTQHWDLPSYPAIFTMQLMHLLVFSVDSRAFVDLRRLYRQLLTVNANCGKFMRCFVMNQHQTSHKRRRAWSNPLNPPPPWIQGLRASYVTMY